MPLDLVEGCISDSSYSTWDVALFSATGLARYTISALKGEAELGSSWAAGCIL